MLFVASLVNADEKEEYGKKVTLKNKTKIVDILNSPAEFEGKKVLIEGKIADVCENKGCWIEVTDSEDNTIKVKVEDGEIVFPTEAEGKTALVEGKVYSLNAESAGCSGHKEESEMKTPACCAGKKSASKIYQIKGIGAVIK